MITLHLQDILTGAGLGTLPVREMPEPGAALSVLHNGRFTTLEVVEVATEPVNEGSLFACNAHWAKCRFKEK